MIKVYQDKFGSEGNCLSAVVASILEVRLSEVPHFAKLNLDKDGNHTGSWYSHLWEYLGQHGFQPIYRYEHKGNPPEKIEGAYPYHIIGGQSPRGTKHAVVGFQGKIIHDPHPDGGGLVKIEDFGWLVPSELGIR